MGSSDQHLCSGSGQWNWRCRSPVSGAVRIFGVGVKLKGGTQFEKMGNIERGGKGYSRWY